MIENIVYSRLANTSALTSLVSSRIYPDVPTDNTQLPFVAFRVSSANPMVSMGGDSGLTSYTVEIDAYAVDLDEVQAIQSAVRTTLHCWSSFEVAGSFLVGATNQVEEYGYYSQATYNVWVRG